MSDEEKHEWDRQPGESSKAYSHFCLYRDAGGERSLSKVRVLTEGLPSLTRLKQLSRKWNWVERCEKYDDYLEYQDRLRQEKDRREMHKRHANIALLGQNIAVKAMEVLLAKIQSGEQGVAPADVTRLVDISVKVERMARGEPSDSHEVMGPDGGPIEFASMSDDERRAEMIRCLKEMGKTNGEASAIAAQLMGDDKRG